jgi:hypothetical protein
MSVCANLVEKGIIMRYIVTIVGFILLNKNKYIYLFLPILLTLFDGVDNMFTIFYKNNLCTKLYTYQKSDKLYDVLSYLSMLLFFELDNNVRYLIMYRLIGCSIFISTRDRYWLILFFDFVKEYLLYLFIFGNNFLYLPLFIFFKMCFEYYYHVIKPSKEHRV